MRYHRVLRWGLAGGDYGLFELLRARQLLESSIAGFAATTVTKADILAMRETVELEKRSIEAGEDDYSVDCQFDFLIAEATKNSVQINQTDTLLAFAGLQLDVGQAAFAGFRHQLSQSMAR